MLRRSIRSKFTLSEDKLQEISRTAKDVGSASRSRYLKGQEVSGLVGEVEGRQRN